MADAQMRWSLVVINPPVVLGPTVSGKSTSASHDICLQLGDGTMKSGAPPFEVGMVDVRDVADAHIRAAYISKAAGRHIVFNPKCFMKNMVKNTHCQPKICRNGWYGWLARFLIRQ